ncbi:MAG: hypothetical protein ACFCAD_13760 [Pleurocapsa sp.]
MEKIKYISIIFAFTCLLNACNFNSKAQDNNSQNTEQDKATIENLPDGNYLYCSDPNPYPYEDKIDAHRYCFTFIKVEMKVVGGYFYTAPKDTPYICIEGKVKNNWVIGIGYEDIGPSSEPYTEEDFSYLNELPDNPPLGYWDDVEGFQGGFNLKVGNPSLYKLSSPSEDKYTSYWATKLYKNAQLNLSNFEHIEANNLPEYTGCKSK